MPGAANNLNVMAVSPLYHALQNSNLFQQQYTINFGGKDFIFPYVLTDGIYTNTKHFVKAFKAPQTQQEQHFTKLQEAIRKDIERAFGVLKLRFGCLTKPIQLWKIGNIENMVLSCIILHNMIIKRAPLA